MNKYNSVELSYITGNFQVCMVLIKMSSVAIFRCDVIIICLWGEEVAMRYIIGLNCHRNR